jgi:acyl carrier protein
MAVTEHDVEQFAARIRLHFATQLRDVAFDLAFGIAKVVGSKAKLLRPETTLDEILAWLKDERPFLSSSLDQVEWIMAMEEECGFRIPDELAARMERATFREFVEHVARRHRERPGT